MARTKGSGDLNGFLDAKSKIEGELRFEDTFRVDGHLQGKITSSGTLIVGEEGRIDGELQVGELFVSGHVLGMVRCSGRVEIAAGARVEADVDTPVLVVEEGAHFSGGCAMGPRLEDTKPSGDSSLADTAVISAGGTA